MSRFVGDGIDTRRPIMSSSTAGLETDTIDLTADDDIDPDAYPHFDIAFSRDHTQEALPELTEPDRNLRRRGPPFPRESMAGYEVINLEDDSGEEAVAQDRRGRTSIPAPPILHREDSSPDLVITGSRPVAEELRELDPQRRLPTPPILRFRFGGQGGITDYLRRGREIIFGTAGANSNLDQLDVQDTYPPLPPLGPFDILEPPAPDLPVPDLPGDYHNVAFNYQRAAFPIARVTRFAGNNAHRSSTPPEVIDPEPYKEPQAVLPGYSRNLAEDDVAICPACEEELASGGDDRKEQVWVSKTCGHVSRSFCLYLAPTRHFLNFTFIKPSFQLIAFSFHQVYCGDCVLNPQSKANNATSSTAKDKKRSKQKISTQLKACVVDGCRTKFTTKGALFQMYL